MYRLESHKNFEGNPTLGLCDQFAESWKLHLDFQKIGNSLSNFHLKWHVSLNENYLVICQFFENRGGVFNFRRIDRTNQQSDSLQNFCGIRVYISSLWENCIASVLSNIKMKKLVFTKSLHFLRKWGNDLPGERDIIIRSNNTSLIIPSLLVITP